MNASHTAVVKTGLITAVLAAVLTASGSAALLPVAALAQAATADSQEIIRQLRSAQARVERTRYRHLPVSFGYPSGRCDERVGRYCYWHNADDSRSWEPAHRDVVRERNRFLALLDSASLLVPGDRWLVGQRVRYLVEADSIGAALVVAQNCRAEPWWCQALRGYAQHAAGDFEAAADGFTSALGAMSAERRCEWNDMSLLLRENLRKEYDELQCDDRDEFESLVWWLADPLYLVAGNERLTDHYTRLVLDEILSQSETVRRSRWRDDNRELLIRYGQIVGWERSRSRGASISSDNVVGHHRKGGLYLIPTARFVADLSTIEPGTWDLEPERPRAAYAPPYATEMVWLVHQISLFKRGDSAVVVATFAVPQPSNAADSAPSEDADSLVAALVLAADWSAPPAEQRRLGQGSMAAVAPFAPTMVSVEVLSRRDSVAARARYWLDIPERIGPGDGPLSMSDILLFDGPPDSVQQLASVIEHALPPGPVERGARLGLYWEVYGVDAVPELATVSLTVEKKGKGIFRRAGEWLGLVGERRDRIEMSWEEELAPAAYATRAMTVQLSPEMQGDYVVTIGVHLSNGSETSAARSIEIH